MRDITDYINVPFSYLEKNYGINRADDYNVISICIQTAKIDIGKKILSDIDNILQKYKYEYYTHQLIQQIKEKVNYHLMIYKDKGFLNSDFYITNNDISINVFDAPSTHYFSDAEDKRRMRYETDNSKEKW